MPRVKGAVNALKRRRKVLKAAKGYIFGRSTKERQAREAILHAGAYALAHRRDKKNDRRRLWTVKLNAALRPLGYSYSRFIDKLKKNKIELDRKVLAEVAEKQPELFKALVEKIG